jgi:glycosyltransferase involved in cell wall biosynthesis
VAARVKIDIFYPHLPPVHDAIGESTVLFARELAIRHDVRLLCRDPQSAEPVHGATLVGGLSGPLPRGVNGLRNAVGANPPDWLLIPFNQFSYDRRGINPWLPLTVARLKREHPGLKIGLLAHEGFSPSGTARQSTLSAIQRAQFFSMGRLSDVVFLATHRWVDEFRSWFPRAAVSFLPIGSNLPTSTEETQSARARFGIDQTDFLVCSFGALGSARDPAVLRSALTAVGRHSANAVAVHIGSAGEEFTSLAAGLHLRALPAGRLPATEAAALIHASDLALSPFRGGVSMRRGSFLAGLQQGVATVTSSGPWTDPPLMRAAAEGAFELVHPDDTETWQKAVSDLMTDSERRTKMAQLGVQYYRRTHEWDVVAAEIDTRLQRVLQTSSR